MLFSIEDTLTVKKLKQFIEKTNNILGIGTRIRGQIYKFN